MLLAIDRSEEVLSPFLPTGALHVLFEAAATAAAFFGASAFAGIVDEAVAIPCAFFEGAACAVVVDEAAAPQRLLDREGAES